MDVVSRKVRSRMMSGIGPKDTRPELQVRRFLHAAGMRYRLHAGKLPGRPDLVLKRHRAVVLVHGCFWHRHIGCRYSVIPGSNRNFWTTKLTANRRRDRKAIATLQRDGWRVAVVWECALRNESVPALARLERWVNGKSQFIELAAPRLRKRSGAD